MEDSLISRQAAIDAVIALKTEHRVSWKDAVFDTLDQLPSAQPKTGKWIEIDNGLDTTCECSQCHFKDYIPNGHDYKCFDRYWFERKFCPNCGAKMEVEQDDSN